MRATSMKTRWLTLAGTLVLASCGPATATLQPNLPPAPTSTAPAPPAPTPSPTAEPRCPEPTEGTQLLRQDRMGYCLLYPDDYIEVQTDPTQVCLVPGEPYLACHSAQAFFNVEDAAGRSVSQVADEMAASGGIIGEPSSLTIAGEEAILFPEVAGQASMRAVLIVHDDRLYRLGFGLPDADPAAVERFNLLYNTVIDSLTLLPTTPPPAPTEATQGTRGSAVVAYIKDGNVLVWEEATGQGQVVFDSGDVIHVELSDDAQLVAFVRRTLLDGNPRYGRSSLWVVDRDGANPRELVSDEQLRALLGASDADDTDFPVLKWIPNSHRLLYSVTFFPAYVFAQGLYLLDVDTQASAEVAPVEEGVDFAPSPDGEHIVVLTQTDLFFVKVDDSLAGEVVSTYPAGGVPGRVPYNLGEVSSLRAWTQDSRAVLVRRGIDFGAESTIWRVPVDEGPAQSLITFSGDNDQLAPDGSVVSFVRGTGLGGVSGRFVVPLPDDLGPLAVHRNTIGLSWSPSGSAFVIGWEEMTPLCANAAQAIEVCGPPFNFGEPMRLLEWIDRERFVYVAPVPTRLMLGSLNGSTTVIAEDLRVPPNAGDGTIALGFDAVASTCSDDSEFVLDVTVPDGTHFSPGSFFQKTWRVRNTGDCTWDASYRFTFLSGDRMSGPRSAPLGDMVEPGEEVDLSVTLIAPSEEGTYTGQWQLFAPDGTPFGARPYVLIVVP